MDFNLDFLAEETLKLTEELYAKTQNNTDNDQELIDSASHKASTHVLDEGLKFSHSESDQYINELFDLVAKSETKEFFQVQASNSSLQLFPERSGLLYRVDNGLSTFCLRGFATNNLRLSFQELRNSQNPDSLKQQKSLGIETEIDTFDEAQIKFFETPDLALAEVLGDQMFRRRFPKDEESLCNLADPGFSWWFNRLENGFEIFFKSQGLERGERYRRLGPMGDIHLAQKQFAILQGLFNDTVDSELDGRSFKVQSLDGHSQMIDHLMELFDSGINHFTLQDFTSSVHDRAGASMYYYLRELAALRSFWSDIQKELT